MTKTAYQVIVIGGGAAGMAAAVAALLEAEEHIYKGERGKVLLLERNDRVGKKILATGNGKCNFTHENVGINNYHTDNPAVLDSILTAFPTEAALRFFDRLGMPAKEKNGYFYPMTETASTVLDVLRLRLAELGCETLCGIRVEQVEKAGDGFVVFFKEEKKTYEIY
ncbi:MAG: NAD(P)/FAD-dependent oxidoreductase, partial [Lachnospiraceae bacterium]|nr:NAD(P)/FAD-dependent oxidoreductase [Lachnospiraceae bacterium]